MTEAAKKQRAPESAAAFSPQAGLASRLAPPLRLPASFFLFATLCLTAAAIGMVLVAPAIAVGSFSDTRVLAVTHLLTLGWITSSILGALCQFLPVALGVAIRSRPVAYAALALFAPGVVIFITAALAGEVEWMLPGGALLGIGLLLFAGNLAATLQRSTVRDLTWWALALATIFLLMTVAFGAGLAGNLQWGYIGEGRMVALAVHIHVAIGGWVALVMVGVAQKLLPMFLLSHEATRWPAKLSIVLLATGASVLALTHHHLTTPLILLVAVTLAGGLLAFVLQATLFFRSRIRPKIDPGMRLAASGLVLLVLAIPLAPVFVLSGAAAPRFATAYVTSLVGGITLFVAGFHYKIIPFLIWFHRFGPLAGKQSLPSVADLYDARIAKLVALLLPAGLLGIIAATLVGSATIARGAALVFAAGVAMLAAQMWTTSRRRP